MQTSERQERFQNLINEHRKIIYKVCHIYCRDREDRDDLAQEIVIQLWRSFERFDERYRFTTWMYRIALNVAISFYRRESTRARQLLPLEEGLLIVVPEADEPEEIRMLYEFIDGMDSLNKALMLLYLDGNSYQEIAEVLGISETNVGTKIGRLKKSIKQQFEEASKGQIGK